MAIRWFETCSGTVPGMANAAFNLLGHILNQARALGHMRPTRPVLLTGTALAFAGVMAAGPASAADKMSIGVHGYMQQWFGMSDVDDPSNPTHEGGVAQHSDSEIWFKGKLEADNGLTFSVKVEIEGNTHSSPVDESQATVSGEFGAITLGAEDGASVLTHHGVRDVGVGILCGDVGAWIDGIDGCSTNGLGTAGHGLGDKNNVTYFSPRVNGVQFGATYIPNVKQEGQTAKVHNNDEDAWSLGGNFKGDFGGANVAVSAGHYSRSLTEADSDSFTYSNFGLQVGMGQFSFDIAYAEGDDGMKTDGVNDVEVVGAGVMYSDGPMSISLSHMMADSDEGTEQAATLLSGSYVLAPGVAWRSTFMAAEKDRSDGTSVEGTALVTGITLGF